jgi:hypothetical protein
VSRVRDRDLRCCITGDLVAAEDFTGFEAAHIFPLSETDIVGLSSVLLLISINPFAVE